MINPRGSRLACVARHRASLAALLLIAVAGCNRGTYPTLKTRGPSTLTVGFGLATGADAGAGIDDTVRSLALERLVVFSTDGRPQGRLLERWSRSDDGLTLRLWLRAGTTFHDGQPVTAAVVRDVITAAFPPSSRSDNDVRQIEAHGDREIEITLNRRSAFVFEGLEITVQQPGKNSLGTGPFAVVEGPDGQLEARANQNYYGGGSLIDRIVFRPYGSVRAAWADMLRGEVDMLYEVGQDALDSLQPSSNVEIFTYERPYAYVLVPNMQRPAFRDSEFRRALNASINRMALVSDVFGGHATPADGPVSPNHWAYDPGLPTFKYEPKELFKRARKPRFTLYFPDASLEHLVLQVQRQLQAVGVDLDLRLVSLKELGETLKSGDFDLLLADAALGPTMLRTYRFWHTGERFNYGGFSSRKVDGALEAIRTAPDDAAYKTAVAAYQRAIIEDPPGIFLVWSQRLRAVSSRFDVPAEPGADIFSPVILRLWRPTGAQVARRN